MDLNELFISFIIKFKKNLRLTTKEFYFQKFWETWSKLFLFFIFLKTFESTIGWRFID